MAAGELVGVAGIDGNGQRELEEVLAGVRRPSAGRLEVDGRPTRFGTRALRARGVAHLSGDRERAGLVGGMSIAENLVLKGSYDDRRFFGPGRYRARAALEYAARRVEAFGIVRRIRDAPSRCSPEATRRRWRWRASSRAPRAPSWP